jgi:hypothetical protein
MNKNFWIALGLLILLVPATWVLWGDRTNNHCAPWSNPAIELYLTPKGELADPIVSLLGLTGIRISNDSLEPNKDWPAGKLTLSSRSLEDVVPVVQGKVNSSFTWIGDPKKERWEEDPKKIHLTPAQAKMVISICRNDLRQGAKMSPASAQPKAILFLGTILIRARARLGYLNELYETKKLSPYLPVYIENLMNPDNGIVRFRSDWQPAAETVINEGQMIKLVFNQSRHKDLPASNIYEVYSSKGSNHRSTTETNILQWLKDYSPESGLYIAISNQPYTVYQESAIRRVLLSAGRPDICVQVVGPAMEETYNTDAQAISQAKNLLNNLSRILYELLAIERLSKVSETHR